MVYQNRIGYKGECAKILHMQADMYDAMGDMEDTVEDLRSRALKMYTEVVESGRLAPLGATLENVDYDKVISVWAL